MAAKSPLIARVRILLISPTHYNADGTLHKTTRYWTSGLTLPYPKALTPSGHEVAMLHELFSDVDLNCDCDLVGITTMGPQILLRYEAFKAGWLYRMYFHWPRSS